MAPDCEVSSCLDKVEAINDHLGEYEIFIGILNDGRHAIAIQGEEDWLLQLGSRVDLGRVGHVELVEEEGYLPRVGSGWEQSAKSRIMNSLRVEISLR